MYTAGITIAIVYYTGDPMTVIGYKNNNREELWEAMLIYKQGYKSLCMNPDTLEIALADHERYQSILKTYVA